MMKCPHVSPTGRVIRLLPVLLSVIVASGCAKQLTESVVARRDIIAYLPVEGTVVTPASSRADVYSPYTSPVGKIYVTVGSNVRHGEALLLLSAPQTQAYYAQARAAVVQAQKALDQARSQYGGEFRAAEKRLALSRSAERKARAAGGSSADGVTVSDTGDLSANRQAAEQDVIDARARMNEGLVPYRQALAAAQEQFASAQAGAKSAQVKSPIDGTVLAINASVGIAPDPDEKKPLVTIVDLEALRVAGGVAEDQLSLLRPGNPATVTIKEVPNVEFAGSLDQIYSEKAGFLQGQKYVALVDFRNTRGRAKPDMTATASIKIGEVHGVLAVPASAVYKSDDHYAVKVRQGKAWRQRLVETGLSDGNYTQIKSGLSEGDVVEANP